MLLDLTKDEVKTVEGGNWLNTLAYAIDNVLDVCDDFQTNGSNRPFEKYE